MTLIREDAMRQHLERRWHLEPALASSLGEQIGSGARDIFGRALEVCTPGGCADDAVVVANAKRPIAHSSERIKGATVALD
jgi:hypothetical protein